MDKHQRYRLKDLDEYRKKKNEYAKTDSQKEKRKLYMRLWRSRNREKSNAARRSYHYRNKEAVNARQKIQHIKYKYGLSLEEFELLVAAQDGKCKLCGNVPKTGKIRGLHVDHSHKTGKVRALLCISCNTVLGRVESIGIEKFARYIQQNEEL